MAGVAEFFDANGIQYGSTNRGTSIKGYNYFTGKEENFSANNSIAVSDYQPKADLVKVLFEPRSKLSDSVTYDITAWSLPFVYGVQAYAVKRKTGSTQWQLQYSKCKPKLFPHRHMGTW